MTRHCRRDQCEANIKCRCGSKKVEPMICADCNHPAVGCSECSLRISKCNCFDDLGVSKCPLNPNQKIGDPQCPCDPKMKQEVCALRPPILPEKVLHDAPKQVTFELLEKLQRAHPECSQVQSPECHSQAPGKNHSDWEKVMQHLERGIKLEEVENGCRASSNQIPQNSIGQVVDSANYGLGAQCHRLYSLQTSRDECGGENKGAKCRDVHFLQKERIQCLQRSLDIPRILNSKTCQSTQTPVDTKCFPYRPCCQLGNNRHTARILSPPPLQSCCRVSQGNVIGQLDDLLTGLKEREMNIECAYVTHKRAVNDPKEIASAQQIGASKLQWSKMMDKHGVYPDLW